MHLRICTLQNCVVEPLVSQAQPVWFLYDVRNVECVTYPIAEAMSRVEAFIEACAKTGWCTKSSSAKHMSMNTTVRSTTESIGILARTQKQECGRRVVALRELLTLEVATKRDRTLGRLS